MKKTCGIAFAFLILLTLPMIDSAFAATNQITNGGFETGNFTGWTKGYVPPLDPPTVVSSVHHTGTYCVMFKTTDYIKQTFSSRILATSDLTFWESSTGTGALMVNVTYIDSSQSAGFGTLKAHVGPWRQYALSVNRVKPVSSVRFTCVGGEAMGVYLDDVSLFGVKAFFADSFSSGAFNLWSGKSVSAGETAYVKNGSFLFPNYYAIFTSNGSGGNEYAFCYKSISVSTNLYAYGEFYVAKSGILDNGDRFNLISLKAASGKIVISAGWVKTGGIVKWRLEAFNGTKSVVAYSKSTPMRYLWYSVTLHWKYGSFGVGIAELCINGVQTCVIKNVNTTAYGYLNQARFGLPNIYNFGSTTVQLDDISLYRP